MKRENINTLIQPIKKKCPVCKKPVAIGRLTESGCIFCQIKKSIKAIRKARVLKRYSISESGMLEDGSGDWVRYEDVKKHIGRK